MKTKPIIYTPLTTKEAQEAICFVGAVISMMVATGLAFNWRSKKEKAR